MLSQSRSMLPSRGPRYTRAQTALPELMLVLLAAACGERYELGEVVQPVEQLGNGPRGPAWALIADGPEDADARLSVEADQFGFDDPPLGDVDGDGYDDYLTADFRLFYGGPRVSSGVFPAAGAAATTFTFDAGTAPSAAPEGSVDSAYVYAHPAGDVDGDGCADILFESRRIVGNPDISIESSSAQRAFLWYGRPDRPMNEVRLDDEGVQFEPLHDLLESLSDGLAHALDQNLRLVGLGDIDGDGYDDVAYTYYAHSLGTGLDTSDTARAATLIYYGASERLPARGATALAAAELPGVALTGSIGDVDGDSFADFWFVPLLADEYRLASGGKRLSGKRSADEIGQNIDVGYPSSELRAAGDLDRDGIDDLLVFDMQNGERFPLTTTWLFYGSPNWASTPIERDLADAAFHNRRDIAGLRTLGDSNGDGFDDLVLSPRVDQNDGTGWKGEARIVPGTAERYVGGYELDAFGSGAPPDGGVRRGGPVQVSSLGDIDGDGFADARLYIATWRIDADGPAYDEGWFVKYGRPLVSEIR